MPRPKYSIEEIKSRVTIEEILDRYGWETQKKGRYTQVLCKFHNDSKYGSAMIYPTSTDYFICFSCGCRYDIFDIYMYEFNCCFAEAVIGVANEYEIAPEEIGTKKPIRCPITRNELAEIGLCHYNRKPESYPIGFVDREYKKSGYRIYRETFCRNPYAVEREEIEYLYIVQKGKSQMEHINNLFEQDREAFKFLLTKKAEDAEKTYTQNYLFLRTISDVLGEKGVTSYLTDTMMYMSLHGIYTARKILATLKRL